MADVRLVARNMGTPVLASNGDVRYYGFFKGLEFKNGEYNVYVDAAVPTSTRDFMGHLRYDLKSRVVRGANVLTTLNKEGVKRFMSMVKFVSEFNDKFYENEM